MRLLLDTHAAVWWVTDDPRLSQRAGEAIDDPGNERLLSAASVWELTIKRKAGKYTGVDLHDVLQTADIAEVPITAAHGRFAADLPLVHGDPFDRVIVAQAMLERCVLVTGDPRLREYGCAVLW
ncbi:PIN domain-containing protein [Conexibacter sp. W3-3-2]|uniref:PIN domain nuclease n=1 Tax=Paraconexibacter algicola TaxID=2133960 RepID=A0A2T4UKW4_9ACTN|nr:MULTISPECIES: type II toxin-antitoxin system VapC family toxin [Solirubrobacterales]MTD46163.1 PIN domain-containing protein [Conexibacter sp. W3-3-2]PTL59838.1 PIN domain nuclease [Paraconexibacter algicola]